MYVLGRLPRVGATLVSIFLLSSLAAAPVFAQSGELHGPGEYSIAGIVAGCGDVETLVTDEGPELIYADGFFTVVVNGPVFDALPAGIRLFAYYQTCGMMLYGAREDAEALADGSAVRRGLADGSMTAAVIEEMCETDSMVVAGWSATPGPERCAAMYEQMRQALQP